MGTASSCGDDAPPHHDSAVLGAAGDDLVIVRAPVDVQHRASVTAYCWVGLVYAAGLWGRRKRFGSRAELKNAPRYENENGTC